MAVTVLAWRTNFYYLLTETGVYAQAVRQITHTIQTSIVLYYANIYMWGGLCVGVEKSFDCLKQSHQEAEVEKYCAKTIRGVQTTTTTTTTMGFGSGFRRRPAQNS